MQTHRGESWMASEAKSEDLMYVSNVSSVTVYSYPAGKFVGTLAGLYHTHGGCVDAAGDVYITGSSQIIEFAHGGTTPLKILKDPLYDPESCSVDPTTGDLAVTNYDTSSGFPGNVAVYRKARGIPRSFIGYSFYYYYFCGYDGSGNLYVDGQDNGGENFEFGELPKNGRAIQPSTLDENIVAPGGIQWDGQYLVVGDQSDPVLYQFAMSKGGGTLAGTVQLGSAQTVREFWIQGSSVVAPNYLSNTSNVLVYAYPAGGSPTKTITDEIDYPTAAVVSLPAKR
jgi:hypothetical protein